MAYADADYDRMCADVQRLERAVNHFQQVTRQGVAAIKEISTAFEAMGAALCEMTSATASATNLPFIGTTATGASPITSELETEWESVSQIGTALGNLSAYMTNHGTAQIHNIAIGFAGSVREIGEGTAFRNYSTALHCDIVKRLIPVTDHLKIVKGISKKYDEAHEQYRKYKKSVDKEERKFTKQGKPFVDQERYRKCASKRDAAHKKYTATRVQFFKAYEMLMEVNGHAAAELVHRCLSVHGEYLRDMLGVVESVLPLVEKAYPMSAEFGSLAPSIVAATAARDSIAETAVTKPSSSSGNAYPSEDMHSTPDTVEVSQEFVPPQITTVPEIVHPVKTHEDYGHVINQWQRLEVGGSEPKREDAAIPGAAEEERGESALQRTRPSAGPLMCSVETTPSRPVHSEAKEQSSMEVANTQNNTVIREEDHSFQVWHFDGSESEANGEADGGHRYYDPNDVKGIQSKERV